MPTRTTTEPPQQRVLTAAVDLFARQGWATTSIRQIAREAHVSIDTIYARGSKAQIFLEALEVVLSGSDDGTPLLEAPDLEQVWNAASLEQVVAGLVDATVRADQRSATMWAAFVEGASSDPVLTTAMLAQNEAMRGEGRRTVEFLKARGLAPTTLDTAEVADLIWAEAHPNRYALLVGLAGWTVEKFRAQLTDTVVRLLTG